MDEALELFLEGQRGILEASNQVNDVVVKLVGNDEITYGAINDALAMYHDAIAAEAYHFGFAAGLLRRQA